MVNLIVVNNDTLKDLQILKAIEDKRSYDELLQDMVRMWKKKNNNNIKKVMKHG